ncbi:Phytosulfokine receptor 2 [Dionaea muscipula]
MTGGGMNMMAFLRWVFMVSFVCSNLDFQTLSQVCNSEDFMALRQFSGNLTDGSILSSWAYNSNCCEWEGVFCDGNSNVSTSNRVIKLKLTKRGLKGMISPSLGRLNQLLVLDLSCNHLQGTLPAELSNLQMLVYVDLSYNLLSGSVLEPFTGLMNIRILNVSSNSFNGTLLDFDFGVLPDMAVFNISNNSFSGQLGSRICTSSSDKIQIINISMNNFSGGLESLQNCSSLQQLHTDSNSLSGQLPDFIYTFTSLQQLSVSGNYFSGQLSDDLSKLSSLESLIISSNRFSGQVPNVFGNLTQLLHFTASSNTLSGPLPSSLSLCSMLRVLDLRNNSFVGPVDIDFTALTNLSVLDLATNHLHGTIPSSLTSCKRLKTLSLAKNELTGELPGNFSTLTSLSFLSLSNNSFANLSSALTTLQRCPNLTTLILTRNFHGEELPRRNLSGFHSLMILALGNCGLYGQVPDWLLNCSKLQVLDLSWNHLNGSIPPWIGGMGDLFYLDLSNNSLSGEIPVTLMQLRSLIVSPNPNISSFGGNGIPIPLYVKRNQSASGLQYNQASSFPPSIYLNNNRFNGTIWREIGMLKQLHVLDLSRNNITGNIPDSVSDMENLEVLDLSYNDLDGEIPLSLDRLTFLSRFSVAYNNLTGPIPTRGQFATFTSSCYEGNPGLCGKMIISSCSITVNDGPRSSSSSGWSSKRSGGRRIRILWITLGVGVGIALLLAVVLLKITPRDAKGATTLYLEDHEASGTPRLSEEGYGLGYEPPPKLVLFQNADYRDLTVVELLKSTDNFSQANIIGCGGFGLVYKATLPNGTKVAIKRLSGDCGQMEREFRAEVEALSRAQHENLVSLQGYCELGSDRLLIYSFMENGSLDYWLHESSSSSLDGTTSVLDWGTRLKIAQGAGHGLAYLHKVCEPNIVHRDIKSSNILLDERFEAHLADFGLSRLLRPYDTHVTTDLVGTLGYIPPEYSQTLTATIKGDVYSFGVVLLELLTGRRPVEVCKGKNCRDLVSWVFQMRSEGKEELVIDTSISVKDHETELLEVLSVACRCLNPDPKQRPSIDQVVSLLDAVGTV